MKTHCISSLSRIAAAILSGSSFAVAVPTVLIDYDDGISGNSQHESSLNNGGFEDANGTNFATTPFWDSYFPEGDASDPISNVSFRTGLLRSFASGEGGIGNRVQPSQIIPAATWTIGAGDVFTFSAWARSGANFDVPGDAGRLTLHVVDATGTAVNGPDGHNRLLDHTFTPAVAATYQFATATSVTVPVGSPWIGQRIQARLRATADRGEFLIYDDVTLTAERPDPLVALTSGSLDFGSLYHGSPASTSSRTITFTNSGPTQSVTINSVSLTSTGGGVYSITSAPSSGTVIALNQSFSVEVTATGGGGGTALPGELFIDVSAPDQDKTLPISSRISSAGDPYPLLVNSEFSPALAGWTTNAVSTGGLGSSTGARLRGSADDRTNPSTAFADLLAQTFSYTESPDFQLSLSFAIPDFDTFALIAADASVLDRSFQLAVLAAGPLPTGTFTSAAASRTIINLFYLPAGAPGDPGAGFFLYDGQGAQFTRLAGLGTLLTSTGYNNDGTPPTTLNVYRLTITGSDFGSPGASYSIAISNPNSSATAATVSGLTTYHGVSPAASTAKALVLSTADAVPETTAAGAALKPSFWVDDVRASLGETLPLALYVLPQAPRIQKFYLQRTGTYRFTIENDGIGSDLVLQTPIISDSRFTLASPAFPLTIAPGASAEIEVNVDVSAVTTDSSIPATLTFSTNDTISPTRIVALEAQVLTTGRRVLVDYDDGIANGIHNAEIRNGGFEIGTIGQNFLDTPSWIARFEPEADLVPLTLGTAPATGTRHGQASGFLGVGERAHPAHYFTLQDWTLEAGDSFEIEVTWKDGNANIGSQLVMEVIDANGAFVNSATGGIQPSRLISQVYPLTTPGTYQTTTATTLTVATNDPWIGARPVFRILGDGQRSEFIHIDNVTVIGRMAAPSEFEITDFNYNAATNQVTLRWTDIGGGYVIEGKNDLDFSTGTTVIPVDGTADTTSFPGQIQFTFTHAAGGPRYFWRVATQ